MSAWRWGEGALDLILTNECMGQRTSSQWSLGDVVVPIKARPILPLPQGNGGNKSWWNAMSQLFLNLAGWPWTSSFTHLGPESLHLWKERWTWGSAGALPAQRPLSDIWSWSSTLSFKSHWAWSFQMLSNIPLYQPLTTPFLSCSPTSQAPCSPRNPILPMVPRAQKWNPSSPSWLHLPSPPSGAQSRPVFN